jgi:hypothetical protein
MAVSDGIAPGQTTSEVSSAHLAQPPLLAATDTGVEATKARPGCTKSLDRLHRAEYLQSLTAQGGKRGDPGEGRGALG